MTEHRDNWSLKKYQAKDSPQQWFVRKNLTPAIAPGTAQYQFIAYLTFLYSPRDATGLPSLKDNETLSQVEGAELEDLEADGLSVFVGAITKGGVKDFLFYTRDPNIFLKKAERFRTSYTQFKVGCQLSPDPKWKQYADLP